ncbi:MAG: hypothetical protein ACE15E_01155 [Acidobacteriota bacterium]
MLRESEFENIGTKEASRLRTAGLVDLACSMALGAATIYYQLNWWARPALFFLLWFGTALLLQARAHTSILLAARRLRRVDGREEPEPYVITLRERARLIQKRSLFVAALVVISLVMCS